METKEKLIKSVLTELDDTLNANQLKQVQLVFRLNLKKYQVEESKSEVMIYDENSDIAAYKQYFVSQKIRGLADSSLKLYMATIDQFMRHVRVAFKDVTTNDIRLYLASREMTDHVSKATLSRERGCIILFFKWLYIEEYIDRDPGARVEQIRIEKRLRQEFSNLEVEKMRKCAETPKESAVMELLLSTGCRVSELCDLVFENLDEVNQRIRVVGKGNKERYVYLNAKASVALKAYSVANGHETGPMIQGRYPGQKSSITGIQKLVKRIGSRAGVPNVHPHRFRRTAATLARRHGMSLELVMQFLGHAQLDTTLKYSMIGKDELQAAHGKYLN